jgi:hypothetical protein
VRDALRGHREPIAIEHLRRLGLAHIDDGRFDAWSLDPRLLGAERRAQNLKRTGLFVEQPGEKRLEIRRHVIAGRTNDRQRLAAHAVARPHQSRQVGRVIRMQVADADHGEIGELGSGLAEAQMSAPADVKEQLRLRADPQQVARRGTFRVERGTAGSEDLHGNRVARAGLGGCA